MFTLYINYHILYYFLPLHPFAAQFNRSNYRPNMCPMHLEQRRSCTLQMAFFKPTGTFTVEVRYSLRLSFYSICQQRLVCSAHCGQPKTLSNYTLHIIPNIYFLIYFIISILSRSSPTIPTIQLPLCILTKLINTYLTFF